MQPTTTIDKTATLGADAPSLKLLKKEAFSLILNMTEQQLHDLLLQFRTVESEE